jgi:dipeptidase
VSKTRRHQQIEDVYDARRHAPTPALVTEGKTRITNGIRLSDDRPERIWYCRSCGHQARAVMIPRDWYSVTRHTGTMDEKPARLGIYCSADCLDVQLDRHIGIETSAGDNWTNTSYRQRPTE